MTQDRLTLLSEMRPQTSLDDVWTAGEQQVVRERILADRTAAAGGPGRRAVRRRFALVTTSVVGAVAIGGVTAIAGLLPAGAVRMRRDVRQLLTCIQTVALLHQVQRERTAEGWIVATIDDYAIAHGLLSAVFDTVAAEGVTPAIRATVDAVQEDEEVSAAVLATRLNLAKSTVSWRVQRALKGGWLVNNETRRGAAMKLSRGVPLPEEASALPSPDTLRQAFECSSAPGDGASPLPPAR